jgi:hypothetical protein
VFLVKLRLVRDSMMPSKLSRVYGDQLRVAQTVRCAA